MTNIPDNVLVDDEDREMLEAMGKWRISDSGYCIKSVATKTIRMHRIIMNPPDNMQVDHINGNRLDNRRCNLRIVTHQQNAFNRTSAKGYRWNKKDKKWVAYIGLNKKYIYLGNYNTEEEARQAYLKAKEELHKI